jgi:hypothetical protein
MTIFNSTSETVVKSFVFCVVYACRVTGREIQSARAYVERQFLKDTESIWQLSLERL